jgi:hypothetical protein
LKPRLVFIYGQPGSGKLTIARHLAASTGFALFHNHLVVDAVAAVFPFGSAAFIELRERFWIEVLREAMRSKRSVIFTFAPEPSVARDFPQRVKSLVTEHSGVCHFVELTLPSEIQDLRINSKDRSAFGKLTDVALMRELRPSFESAQRLMPPGEIVIDTGTLSARAAADQIKVGLTL